MIVEEENDPMSDNPNTNQHPQHIICDMVTKDTTTAKINDYTCPQIVMPKDDEEINKHINKETIIRDDTKPAAHDKAEQNAQDPNQDNTMGVIALC